MRSSTFLLLAGTSLTACAMDHDDPPATAIHASSAPERAVERLLARRDGIGLDTAHTFDIKRAIADVDGQTHVRITQRYKNVPILGASATIHLDADGNELALTDALARAVDLDVTPRLSAAEAIAAAEAGLHVTPYRHPSVASLAIVPEHMHVRTAGPRAAGDARDNAADYERRTTAYRLVYRVETSERVPIDGRVVLVDANTGEIVRATDVARAWDYTGHNVANTHYSGHQEIDVTGPGYDDLPFQLVDPLRDDMEVYDFGGNHSGDAMSDGDGIWGDGNAFVAGVTERETAGVDAYFGLEVVWDMYKRVFNWAGVDGEGSSIPAGVHDPDAFDNSFFSDSIWGNYLAFGDSDHDGGTMCDLDVVGHEFTHAVNNATADVSGDEGDALNEGNSDIFGVLGHIYFFEGSRGAGSIPDNATSDDDELWELGRDLFKPGSGSVRSMFDPTERYYFSTIGNDDPHVANGPMDRAFFFLAQGSSAHVTSRTWSHSLPWGMTGLGNDEAGRVWFHALTTYLQSDDGYAQARDRAIDAARDRTGMFGVDEKAVRNAFGGIDVGDPAVDAPADPASVLATGTIDSETLAQAITFPSATPVSGLRKIDVIGLTRIEKDDFKITVPCGKTFGARLETGAEYDLAVFQSGNSTALDSSQNGSQDEVVSLPSNAGCSGSTTFFVRVLLENVTLAPLIYTLHLELQD